MELVNKEQSKRDFLKNCRNLIKKYPSKNITGECENCFLYYIQSNLDFSAFVKNNLNYTDCYKIAYFLQDAGLIKIKNGTVNSKIDENRTAYSIDCYEFSFLALPERNRI